MTYFGFWKIPLFLIYYFSLIFSAFYNFLLIFFPPIFIFFIFISFFFFFHFFRFTFFFVFVSFFIIFYFFICFFFFIFFVFYCFLLFSFFIFVFFKKCVFFSRKLRNLNSHFLEIRKEICVFFGVPNMRSSLLYQAAGTKKPLFIFEFGDYVLMWKLKIIFFFQNHKILIPKYQNNKQ